MPHAVDRSLSIAPFPDPPAFALHERGEVAQLTGHYLTAARLFREAARTAITPLGRAMLLRKAQEATTTYRRTLMSSPEPHEPETTIDDPERPDPPESSDAHPEVEHTDGAVPAHQGGPRNPERFDHSER